MDEKPTYDELESALFARFPSLLGEYDRLLSARPLSGNYAIYLNVFYPFLLGALSTGEGPLLREIFAFMEDLATNRKERVQQLLADAVLEVLVEDPRALVLAWPHLGDNTRIIVKAIAQASGQISNLPPGA